MSDEISIVARIERQPLTRVSLSTALCYIYYIQKGDGGLFFGQEHYSIGEESACCLIGRSPVFFDQSDLKGYQLMFPLDFFHQVKKDMNLRLTYRDFDINLQVVIPLSDGIRAEMEPLLLCMSNEFRDRSEYRQDILSSLLKVFLIRLIRQIIDAGRANIRSIERDEVVDKFIGLVYENFSTLKKVADYADVLCIAPNYLNTRVKGVTGLTASSLIKNIIIAEAKKQVSEKGLTLKEVAYQLGYDDTAHFSKFFKRAAGTNYSSFKRAANVSF